MQSTDESQCNLSSLTHASKLPISTSSCILLLQDVDRRKLRPQPQLAAVHETFLLTNLSLIVPLHPSWHRQNAILPGHLVDGLGKPTNVVSGDASNADAAVLGGIDRMLLR